MSFAVARAILFASKRGGVVSINSRQALAFHTFIFLLMLKVILHLLSFSLLLSHTQVLASHYFLSASRAGPVLLVECVLRLNEKGYHGSSPRDRAEEPLLVCLLLDLEGVLVLRIH